jgi:chromosome segregation ATPase
MAADDIEVIHMTAVEWDQALTNSLNALGLTWEQLTEQAKTGDFSSLKARQLWLMAAGQGPNQAGEDLAARLAEAEARAEFAEGELSALRDHCARWETEKARADKAEAELAEARESRLHRDQDCYWRRRTETAESERDALEIKFADERLRTGQLADEVNQAEVERDALKAEVERLTNELGQYRLDEQYEAMATAGAYDEEDPY